MKKNTYYTHSMDDIPKIMDIETDRDNHEDWFYDIPKIMDDIPKIMDIETDRDNHEDWFYDICDPTRNKQNILLTNKIILILNDMDPKVITSNVHELKTNMIQLLNDHKIYFTTVHHDDQLCINNPDIQDEIKQLTSDELNNKTWPLLTITNFKQLISKMPTTAANEIQNYYTAIEKIVFGYLGYIG